MQKNTISIFLSSLQDNNFLDVALVFYLDQYSFDIFLVDFFFSFTFVFGAMFFVFIS